MPLLVGKPSTFLRHSLKKFISQVCFLSFVTGATINLVIKDKKATHRETKVDDGSFIGGGVGRLN